MTLLGVIKLKLLLISLLEYHTVLQAIHTPQQLIHLSSAHSVYYTQNNLAVSKLISFTRKLLNMHTTSFVDTISRLIRRVVISHNFPLAAYTVLHNSYSM